jgi:hypothetical protein
MITLQDGQDHGFAPTPRREHLCRVGWEKVVKKSSDLQAS